MKRNWIKNLLARKYVKEIKLSLLSIILFSVILWISALGNNLFVQYGNFLFQRQTTLKWLVEHWQLFIGSSFIITILMLFFFSLSRNIGLAIVIPSGVIVLLGYTNYLALITRGRWSPLQFDDLRLISEAGTMASLISRKQLAMYGFILLLSILLIAISLFFAPRLELSLNLRVLLVFCSFVFLYITYSYAVEFPQTKRNIFVLLGCVAAIYLLLFWRKYITGKWLAISLGICAGIFVTMIILNQNPVRQFVVARSPYPDGHWSADNYIVNGFTFAFIRSMSPKSLVKAPDDFSIEAIEEIIYEYTKRAKMINQNRDNLSDTPPNIIIIMSEAFSDPTTFDSNISFNRDPIPYTRQIMERGLSGSALVNVYGGATIVPEFQALTGFYTLWFDSGSLHFYDYIIWRDSFPSIANFLNGVGYTSTAIHSYGRSFYRRDNGLGILGFGEFIAEDNMIHTYREGIWIADSAAYQEVIDVIRGETGQFVFLITMQNHFPYPAGLHPDINIYVSGDLDSYILESVETHARGLYISDRALQFFISELEELSEPSVILFFGDHLPATIPDSFFRENDYTREQFETPFFIYSTHLPLQARNLGSVSPIFFNYLLLEAMNMPISPFHALQGELFQHIQAMHWDWYINTDNVKRQQSEWDEPVLTIIEKMMMIQYDVISGNQISYNAGFFDIP